MRKVIVIALLALAALASVAGCKSGENGEAGSTSGVVEQSGGSLGAPLRETPAASGGGGEDAAKARPLASSVPDVGPQVVQTASVRLSVRRGRFDETVDEARSIATGLGGFVVSSSASQGAGQRLVEGTLVLRIPARSYADAMESLAALGRVESRNENGQDVSQEFVDLRARTRQLQAVESQLLELLDRAETVGAALAVQQQLSQVQLELEQARGRLQYLDGQVAFATVSLAIHEHLIPAAKDDGGSRIVDAWSRAADGFLAVVGWTFVILATLAPAFLLVFLVWLLARSGVRRKIGPLWPRLKSD
jgi:hypothetical protein